MPRTSFFLIFCTIFFSGNLIHSQVTTWLPPDGFSSEKYYSVKVNGESVPVYDTPAASWAAFDFTGKVTVDITTMFDVRWVDIRPMRTGLKPEYLTDNSFRFTLENPENLSLELNGRIRQQPLFIFAGKPEKDKPSRTDKNVIWFEGGKLYKDIALELTDNQTVYIEGGAVVQGYIWAKGKKNVKICGRGILDGTFVRETKGNNHRFISMTDCDNAKVEGITLHNGTTWQVALYNCTRSIINGIRIVSESGGDDGMDIFRCRNILVENVFAHTKDDCIAIKSGGKYPGSVPTDSISVRNCVFWNSLWGNAVEVGFELYSDEVKNIRFDNIDIIHVEDGAAMSIHNAGPSFVHDVVFNNIRVEYADQKLFDVAIFYSEWAPDGSHDQVFRDKYYMQGAWDGVLKIPPGKEKYHRQFRGRISNITFKNISVIGGPLPFSVFHGFDSEKDVSGVIVENLTFMGKRVTNIEDAKIRLQNTHNFVIR